MPFELTYATIEQVAECWNKVRQIKNYEQIFGKAVFKRFLAKCPEAKLVFGFPTEMDLLSPQTFESKAFITQADVCISMLDANVDMLGADMDIVNENLLKFSDRHNKCDARLSMLQLMEESFLSALDEVLPANEFTKADRDAWNDTASRLFVFMARHHTHHGDHHHHHHSHHSASGHDEHHHHEHGSHHHEHGHHHEHSHHLHHEHGHHHHHHHSRHTSTHSTEGHHHI